MHYERVKESEYACVRELETKCICGREKTSVRERESRERVTESERVSAYVIEKE